MRKDSGVRNLKHFDILRREMHVAFLSQLGPLTNYQFPTFIFLEILLQGQLSGLARSEHC